MTCGVAFGVTALLEFGCESQLVAECSMCAPQRLCIHCMLRQQGVQVERSSGSACKWLTVPCDA